MTTTTKSCSVCDHADPAVRKAASLMLWALVGLTEQQRQQAVGLLTSDEPEEGAA